MTSPLAGAVAGLFAGLTTAGGESVKVWRGTNHSDSIVAVPTNPRDEDVGPEISVSSRDRDWIFKASEWVVNNSTTTPQKGDTIDWIDAGLTTHTFEVVQRDGRYFRPISPDDLFIRVFTIEVHTIARPGG